MMKSKHFISLLIIALMLFSALPLVAGPALAAAPSPWAVPEMNEANIHGLLTPSASRNYRKQLTRDEFCEIVVKLVETVRGAPLPLPGTNPFRDTNSIYILKAYQYGITNGTSGTTFSPNDNVQRQQICAMMIRALQGLEKDLGRTLLAQPAQSLPFTDAAKVASYAVLPARYAYTNGIMQGDGLNRMNPKDPITSEECVAIANRSYNRTEDVLAPNRSTAQNLDAAERRLTIGYAFGDSEYGVTQNIVLPTRGPGDASIAWSSSNTGIISIGNVIYNADNAAIARAGIVSVGSSAQSVTLTAEITLNGQRRTKTFTLWTSTSSGDRLVLENAVNSLDIIYIMDGDSAGSVTGRIGLPNKVLDLPVTWATSDSGTVTTAGLVYPPSGIGSRSVRLTATIKSGSQTRTKTFDLTVVNRLYNSSAMLHGVELGSTQSQVAQILGTATKTIQAGSSETWQLYYSADRSNFRALAFINNRVAAVYSMASNAANQLRNNAGTVITIEQANAVSGVRAVSYADASQQYAIMIYDTGSAIGSRRTLSAEGQEELLSELVNAYRARNGRAALEWTAKLAAPSRQHSDWLRSTGSAPGAGSGSNSLTSRAQEAGFTATGNRPLYGGGAAMAGQDDAFGFLQEAVSASGARNELLSASATLFGAGFVSASSGTYRTYMTYMLGNVRFITGVTASPMTGSPAVVSISGSGAAVTVTLAPAYTSLISNSSYNEPFTAESSDKNRMTVAYAAGGSTCVLTGGSSAGDASLVITGSLSGKSYKIPVNVGTGNATNLQLTYQAGDLIPVTELIAANQTSSSRTSSYTLVVGVNETLYLSAIPTAAAQGTNPTVTWTRSDTGATTTGTSFSMIPGSAGNYTVTASVQRSSGTITHTVNVNAVRVQMSQTSIELGLGDQSPAVTVASVSDAAVSPSSYVWTPTSSGVAWVNSGGKTASETIKAADSVSGMSQSAVITATAVWNSAKGGVNYLGTAKGTVNVTVNNDAVTITAAKSKLYQGEEGVLSLTLTQSQISSGGFDVNWRIAGSGTSVSIVGSDTGIDCRIKAWEVGKTTIAMDVRKKSDNSLVGSAEIVIEVVLPPLNITPPAAYVAGQSAYFRWDDRALLEPMGYSVFWDGISFQGAAIDQSGTIQNLLPGDSGMVKAELRYNGVNIGISEEISFSVAP